jgi:hypothetical protein
MDAGKKNETHGEYRNVVGKRCKPNATRVDWSMCWLNALIKAYVNGKLLRKKTCCRFWFKTFYKGGQQSRTNRLLILRGTTENTVLLTCNVIKRRYLTICTQKDSDFFTYFNVWMNGNGYVMQIFNECFTAGKELTSQDIAIELYALQDNSIAILLVFRLKKQTINHGNLKVIVKVSNA